LSNEVSPRGIRVVTVSPGFIETDAATRMIQRMADKDQSDYATARQKLMEMLGGIPLGRPNRRCGRRHFMDLGANLLCI
jgi:NAD(P)-dependent dehydrogenase (short-subunit alcohol dehydrogenase family)